MICFQNLCYRVYIITFHSVPLFLRCTYVEIDRGWSQQLDASCTLLDFIHSVTVYSSQFTFLKRSVLKQLACNTINSHLNFSEIALQTVTYIWTLFLFCMGREYPRTYNRCTGYRCSFILQKRQKLVVQSAVFCGWGGVRVGVRSRHKSYCFRGKKRGKFENRYVKAVCDFSSALLLSFKCNPLRKGHFSEITFDLHFLSETRLCIMHSIRVSQVYLCAVVGGVRYTEFTQPLLKNVSSVFNLDLLNQFRTYFYVPFGLN